jgi:hypothetical protein
MSDQGPEFPKYPGDGSAEGGQPAPPPPDLAPSAPERPSSISTAVKLMWAGAALAVIGAVLGLITTDKATIAEQMREADSGVTQTEIDAGYISSMVILVIFSVIAVGLWAWMAWKNGQGRSWARVVATVLGGLGILSTLGSLAFAGAMGAGGGGGTGSIILGVVQIGLTVVILVLLWKKQSTEYYEAVSAQGMKR